LEEESGSGNLVDFIELAKEATGIPDALFVLDSACMDYNSLWLSSSFKGMVVFDVTVQL
jgi:acetylornithine deacetylase/succinyl-diaminopimelate desuccinylase-like protein